MNFTLNWFIFPASIVVTTCAMLRTVGDFFLGRVQSCRGYVEY